MSSSFWELYDKDGKGQFQIRRGYTVYLVIYLNVYMSSQIWLPFFKTVPFCYDVIFIWSSCLKMFYQFIFVYFYYHCNIIQGDFFRLFLWGLILQLC